MKLKCKEGNNLQIKRFVLEHLNDTNIATLSYMKEQICCINEMHKNKEMYKGNDIREFLINKRKDRK